MMKRFFIIVVLIITACKKENTHEQLPDTKRNMLRFNIDFPSTIYTNKKYKGKITFYNPMLDTIAEPRRDTTNFRFIIYKPFKPYLDGDISSLIFKDSVLLDKNIVDIEFEFDQAGTYKIGGFARDAIRMNYYTNGLLDSARFIENELILFHKVVVKDSI